MRMAGPVQYEFGHGLSYSNFTVSEAPCRSSAVPLTTSGTAAESKALGEDICLEVTNTGAWASKHVLLAFLAPPPAERLELGGPAPSDRPRRSLRAFGGVFLQPGQTKTVKIGLDYKDVSLADSDGKFSVVKGPWLLTVDSFRKVVVVA